jgi:aldose 1-epimerase
MERLQSAHFEGQWQGEAVGLFSITHPSGMSLSVCNWGAKVLQWCVPNRQGRLIDVCLGYGDWESLRTGAPSMGAFIGRYAGRIANAGYDLHGQRWVLGANDGLHCLHGGPAGSRYRVFRVLSHTQEHLVLGLRFTTERDGHPGELDLAVTYRWSGAGGLLIEHRVTSVSGPPSPISCTPHLFFNLSDEPTIDNHTLWVDHVSLLSLDDQSVATGQREPAAQLPWHLRSARRLGDCPPWDHALELAPASPDRRLRCVARLEAISTGLGMEVWTTEPVLQVYTADGLGRGVSDRGKAGKPHRPRSAVCLEPQQYPNAMHCPDFPLALVAPKRPFQASTEYRFVT